MELLPGRHPAGAPSGQLVVLLDFDVNTRSNTGLACPGGSLTSANQGCIALLCLHVRYGQGRLLMRMHKHVNTVCRRYGNDH